MNTEQIKSALASIKLMTEEKAKENAHAIDFDVRVNITENLIFELFVNAKVSDLKIIFVPEYTDSLWRSRKNGKFRIRAATRREAKSFPQRKDGSFNYEAVADFVFNAAKTIAAEHVKEARISSNDELVEALKEKFSIPPRSQAVCSSYTIQSPITRKVSECISDPGKVFIRIPALHVTPEKAESILRFLKEQGEL